MVRKKAIERRKVWKLKENDKRARFEGRVGELVSTDALDLWKSSDTCWWNENVKEIIARKKDGHKETRKSGIEANKARYKNMKEGSSKSNGGGS